ncbi:MAG TPA: ATP-binding protein [Polyangiaceae bacterium]|nr:ATP-binding protein [Polyangiaceae bacterium]
MVKDVTRSGHDTSLWQRILLVGLIGALPLFVVSLLLINVAYDDEIDFGMQERRGNAFQRPLQGLLELLSRHQAVACQPVAAQSKHPELLAVEQQIDEGLRAVASEYEGELGRALEFSDAALRARNRDNARLSELKRAWDTFDRTPGAVALCGQANHPLTNSVRAMISYAGDRSNLILDDDLDSFYVMDITLGALPQLQQRLGEVGSRVANWLRKGQVAPNAAQIALMAAMLRVDLERITRDAQTALGEDAEFNGVSLSLQHNLPPAVEREQVAEQRLVAALERIAAGEAVPITDFEAMVASARAESLNLFRVGADELDRLLAIRIRAIQSERLQAYSTLFITLAFSALGIGLTIRSLLASRYAEILKNQAELRSKEAQLRALGDNLPGGMIYQVMRDFDGSLHFLYVSAGIERLHGISVDAVLAKSSELYDRIFPEDLPALRAAEQQSLTSMNAFHVLARTRHADGSMRWMECFSAPRQLQDARVVWDGIQMDVTLRQLAASEQKQAAEQQKELEEQLRQAQKLEALGTLAGGIAHDFNNILGAIISYAEVSKMDNPDNPALQDNLDEVLRASHRAATLVRQILSFSRHQKEERQELQLAPIIREALSLLRATLPSTIALQQKIDAAYPNVLANPTQVHQIVMNLCTNSAHAMRGQQGQISVELDELMVQGASKPHVELRPGPYLRLSISDTGQGMDAATQQRIFEPFFTTKPSGEGTGLGLSVVHGIVKEYQGVVTVDSVLGRGTRLCIYLPARPVTEVRTPTSTLVIPLGAGERILFVDDEPALGDVAFKMMQRLGYRALVFQSSQAALSAFRNEPRAYDALVTDLTMPGMTGIELARHVLALHPGFPIILASGSSGSLTANEVREMGIRDLISKPVDYETLARMLAHVLQRRRSERPVAHPSP